ncbi:GvpL/GvpF family gas vesicle protein [Streptomyces albus]|uniref:GvpL/GvpF family gas vesicle protein n=1 Tax=Streptomyces albus TaxID=1888 RepID=UPI0004C85761|nr:GvpL/GvpF family gas vesicle protein [Streptomyces albus]
MTAAGLYVYGVVRTGHPLPAGRRGVGDPPGPLRLIRHGAIAAVAGPAPPGLRARRRDLLAHQELLLALAADGPVLPMRFGMVAPDEDTVLRDLAAGEQERSAALTRLDGRCELNLKASPVEDGLAALLREDEGVRRLRDEVRGRPSYQGSLRLGESVAAGLTRRAKAAVEQVLRACAPLAEQLVEGPDVQGCVRNVSFLVGRDNEAPFRAAVERLAAEHRDAVELRLTGPLPCYSFADPGSVPATA